nr:hypothetical protein [Pandoravirus massiliensis]
MQASAQITAHLSALYPTVRAKDLETAAMIDNALLNVPHRWQRVVPDGRASVPLLDDRVAVQLMSMCMNSLKKTITDGRPQRIVMALRNESGLAWLDYACVADDEVPQPTPNTGASDPAAAASASAIGETKAPVESKDSTQKECASAGKATAPTPASSMPAPQEQKQQTPAEIVALYPHLAARHAAKVLLIEDAVSDIPHYWADTLADGKVFYAVEPEGANEMALVERVRFIASNHTTPKSGRLALMIDNNAKRLNIVVPRPASAPKRQSIDELLDLYPTLTARARPCA